MYLNTDYQPPQALTGFARAALMDFEVNQFTLSRWLPSRPVNDLEYRFTRGGEALVEAATYRDWDTEAPIAARPGATRVTGELPPISRKMRMGEYDRLKARYLDPEIASQLLDDTTRLTKAIAARAELARGDALVNAAVTITENGISVTVDFARRSAHSVSAGTVWSNPAADAINDLLTWTQTYLDNNGAKPGVTLMSTRIANYLLRNTGFRNLMAAGAVSAASVVSRAAVNQIMSDYGLPPIVTYDASVSVGGVATKIIPDDKLLLLPDSASPMGATMWGTTAEALDAEFNISATEAPGIVAGAWSTRDPIALWTKADAIMLPVLANPDWSFVADVL